MTYQLVAAEISLYSGKARAYLRHKRVPFREVLCTRDVIERIVYPRTGLRMVPVLLTDDGSAVQDTTGIIDFCEARFVERAVYPTTPQQRLAALLLEVFGDEWLLLPAMHYRWAYKRKNLPLVAREFGELVAPGLPPFAHPVAGLALAAYFGGAYGPVLGVTRKTRPAIERTYESFLRAFDAHLERHPYLLGGRPSIGDFGLMAPLYAHLYRDPYPGALMRRLAPRVADWVERMNRPPDELGAWCEDDEVPATLDPIFGTIFGDMWDGLRSVVRDVETFVAAHPDKAPLPRLVGRHEFAIDGARATRSSMAFTQWMAQRPLGFYAALPPDERRAVDGWLRRVGGHDAMQLRPGVWLERRHNRLYPAPGR